MNLESGGGCSLVEGLVSKVQHWPEPGSHTVSGGRSIGSKVDGENDIGNETRHSDVRPARQSQYTRANFST